MSKEPHLVLDSIYAFPPNRYTLGGTAYLIVKNQGNLLIDCPIWDEDSAAFIHRQGGVSQLILTHRGGISEQLPKIQSALNCPLLIQEQEAYQAGPNHAIETFHHEKTWPEGDRLLWTPGHSPGSACFYAASQKVLFTGRHLLPDREGQPTPVKTPKTFHWPRQKQSVLKLVDQFSPATLQYILPAASTGLLRGHKYIDQAYERLAQLKMDAL